MACNTGATSAGGFSHDQVVQVGAALELPKATLPGAAEYCIRRFGYERTLSYAKVGVRFIYMLDELIEHGVEPEDLDALKALGSLVDDYLAQQAGVHHLTMAMTSLYNPTKEA